MNKHRKTEWFDDDTLWRTSSPLLFSKKRGDDVAEALPKVLRLIATGRRSRLAAD